jgi:pimeloyl-ACP methyl ester carboxylesterase
MKRLLVVAIALAMVVGCAKMSEPTGTAVSTRDGKACSYTDPGVGSNGAAAWGNDFKTWLNNNGYSDIASSEGWGGKAYSTDCSAVYQPVIFVHGNGDYAQFWSNVRSEFRNTYGYYPSELYAIGWGLKGLSNTAYNHHKADYMTKIRRLIAAVKAYTGKSQVDVIAHSMGVTLARKAIVGGYAYNTYDRSGTAVNLGSSIKTSVDTFVGIAGGNRGLNSCGWWDGGTAVATYTCWANGLSIDNPFIDDLTYGSAGQVATYIYSIKSWVDEVVCYPSFPTYCYVWSVHTSDINGQTGTKSYSTAPYGHFGVREYTAGVQKSMVLNHTIP